MRLLDTGSGRKTDDIDARAVAVIASGRALPPVIADDHAQVLRLISDQRDELTQARRRVTNRLHRHLRDLVPGGAPTHLSAKTASKMLAKIRPGSTVELERKRIAKELLGELRRLDKAMAQNRQPSREAVAAADSSLVEIFGISEILAAKIIGQVGDVTRFPSADHLASYAGTAPIEASSGDVIRHRLSRRGNRKLNNAIHLAAHVQNIRPGQGQDYYQRRLAARNSRKEALRALKRQIAKAIYRAMRADHERQTTRTQLTWRRYQVTPDGPDAPGRAAQVPMSTTTRPGQPKSERTPPDHTTMTQTPKEAVRFFYDIPNPDLADRYLAELTGDLGDDEFPPEVRSLGRSLTRWRTQIINWHRARTSNGPAEAINNLVKRAKRVAFGFRRFRNYRIRVLLYAGQPDWDLLATITPTPR